jgi:cob(I)alamin adenosyltransferase
MTSLMYGRRVSKCSPRVEACGAVDELSAAIGIARAEIPEPRLKEQLESIQRDLVGIMGELATAPEDLGRYKTDGYPVPNDSFVGRLDVMVKDLEDGGLQFKGWAMPGLNKASAALDLARAICRRAERAVCALQESGTLENPIQLIYLNRLSDLLWLMARQAEASQ